MSNSGTIAALTNSGKIAGGSGGSTPVEGLAGDAITSTGSIGTIANPRSFRPDRNAGSRHERRSRETAEQEP
jgi:hypothetical protein